MSEQFNYGGTRDLAGRLIARFGQEVPLQKPGARTGPAHDSSPGSPTNHLVWAVDLQAVEDRDKHTTREILVSSTGITPEPKDKIQIGGAWHEIGPVKTLAPAGLAVLYTLTLVD